MASRFRTWPSSRGVPRIASRAAWIRGLLLLLATALVLPACAGPGGGGTPPVPTRLEETWGPGEVTALLTGTVISKDRNFWLSVPIASWYVRRQDRKGGALLGGLLAYDMVSVERHQGRAESKKLTSLGLLGIFGKVERRMLDGSRGYSESHWVFPFYRYHDINGQRTVYPLFIFPVALREEENPGSRHDAQALALDPGAPIDPPEVGEDPRLDTASALLPPPREAWGRPTPAAGRTATESDDEVRGSWRAGGPAGDSGKESQPAGTSRPAAGGTTAAPPPQPSTYTVQSGDTLFRIARKVYGRTTEWKRIYEANRDQLASPDRVVPGMVLKIPR